MEGYIRLKIDYNAVLCSNFTQQVYSILETCDNKVRYNPKIIWTGAPPKKTDTQQREMFAVADLQQMKDPMKFIESTINQYSGLDIEKVRTAFEEVMREVHRMKEEENTNDKTKLQ